MVKLEANLQFMFNEYELIDRYEQASKAGFKGVELQAPYSLEKDQIFQNKDKTFLNKDKIFLNKDKIFLNKYQIFLNKDQIFLNND